jgi:hypothetical protein
MDRLEIEARRQGRQAYLTGKPRNGTWPIDFLAGYDAAAADDALEVEAPRRPRGKHTASIATLREDD